MALTKAEAIALIHEHSQDVISVEAATQLIEAFDVTLEDHVVREREHSLTNSQFAPIAPLLGIETSAVGVAMWEVAGRLADHLGLYEGQEAWDDRFGLSGEGFAARFRSERAARALEKHIAEES